MVAPAKKFLDPVDEPFARSIQALLNGNGHPPDQRLKLAGEQLIEWMALHGRIIQAKGSNEAYYLYRDKKQLYKLETDRFKSWVYLLTGVNPASKRANYLLADCQAAGFDGEQVEVCKLAHWDGNYLRVSSFDGNVWRLDGQTIEQEANGEGPILFNDDQWEPYTADFTGRGTALAAWLNLLNASDPVAQNRFALLAYMVGVFFTELCPTRPILLIQGEKGSGKSFVLRVMLKQLFGSGEDVFGIPDREEAFATAASKTLVMVIDNLDDVKPWLRDKLARMTTGAKDPVRVLYKTNELMMLTFRTWVLVTARTPDTLRRDDLADRLLILSTNLIPATVPEHILLAQAAAIRSAWWGDLLLLLNRIVANIRAGKMPQRSPLRMADFEALGRLTAITEDKEDVWDSFVKTWRENQKAFLLEDSVITDALEMWLTEPMNRGREVDVRSLYIESEEKLFGVRPNKPDQNWPKSSVWFGRQLTQLRRSLKNRIGIEWRDAHHKTLYTLDVIR